MAHSLITPPPLTTTTNTKPSIIAFQRLSTRRNVSLGLVGAAVLGLNLVVGGGGGDRNAYAASRRPPPPPPREKKDPSLSGLQAKVLASKKRKEAMKEEVAKLREKGKAVNE